MNRRDLDVLALGGGGGGGFAAAVTARKSETRGASPCVHPRLAEIASLAAGKLVRLMGD